MLGAIAGDVVGSTREFNPIKTKAFDLLVEDSHFTDDSVLTIAVGMAIVGGLDLAATLRAYSSRHVVSYGMAYWLWVRDPSMGPYHSWANGGAMRVSAAAWLASDTRDVLRLARWSAEPTHDHPEAVRAAEAVALAIHLARAGWPPGRIEEVVSRVSGYALHRRVDDLRLEADFECKAWISVPRAIACALQSTSFEDAIRNAVSLGGDADTEAAIAGAIAEPLHGIGQRLGTDILRRLPEDLRRDLKAIRGRSVEAGADPAVVQSLQPWDPDCVRRWQSAFDVERSVPLPSEERPPVLPLSGWRRRLQRILGRNADTPPAVEAVPAAVLEGRDALRLFEQVRRSYGCREMAVREAGRSVLPKGTVVEQLATLLNRVAAQEEFDGGTAGADLRRGMAEYVDTEMLDMRAVLALAEAANGGVRRSELSTDPRP